MIPVLFSANTHRMLAQLRAHTIHVDAELSRQTDQPPNYVLFTSSPLKAFLRGAHLGRAMVLAEIRQIIADVEVVEGTPYTETTAFLDGTEGHAGLFTLVHSRLGHVLNDFNTKDFHDRSVLSPQNYNLAEAAGRRAGISAESNLTLAAIDLRRIAADNWIESYETDMTQAEVGAAFNAELLKLGVTDRAVTNHQRNRNQK